ncbi:hypothetical protein EC991_009432 [Linnemannia zychae]|nr:hypothetical protein EC991_009432 [Linnemannia zychae]
MSRQQHLARQFLSLNLVRYQQQHISCTSPSATRLANITKSRSWINQQPVSRFHLSARSTKEPAPARERQQHPQETIAAASSSSPARGPQSRLKNSRADTRRKAQRANGTTTITTSSSSSTAASTTNSVSGEVRLNKTMDKKQIDAEILRLVREKTPWKDIDAALNLPHSTAHHRFYTRLDPALKVWKLPNGQPNVAMQDRLVYLVEIEKLSFADIEKYKLMDEPWKTPTPFAPVGVLEAAGVTMPGLSESTGGSAPNSVLPKKNSGGPFNRVSLQKKYQELKALAATTTLRENEHLMRRAIQRSVELYGENWKAVAAHSDLLLDQWIKPAVSRIALTPNKAATIFRALQRTGVDWGLEDDVVMTRKILTMSRQQPGILDILTKPFSETGQQRTDKHGVVLDQELQRRYWTEISIALGSHSPSQCQRRWKGLWNLHDIDKSAQSKSWHRFERFQYWMLWKYFSQRQQLGTGDAATLIGAEDLQAACEELSFSKEIARWMRHRSETQCEKFFRSSIRSVLNPGQDKLAAMTGNISSVSSSTTTTPQQPRQFASKESIADAITAEVADPFLIKMSVIAPENKDSIRADPQQPMVRSEWTPERIRTLNEIVVQEKQGVHRADFELDWDRVAEALERKYVGSSSSMNPELGKDTETTGNNSSTDELVPPPYLLFTPKQCQSCWEYISTIPTSQKQTNSPIIDSTINSTTTAPSPTTLEGKDGALHGWSENEILLLQQGVRKYGTLWADIRAQFLPSRDISDLQRAWFSISVSPSSEETVGSGKASTISPTAAVDRLSEPDYVGLLSALNKVGGSSENNTSEKSK